MLKRVASETAAGLRGPAAASHVAPQPGWPSQRARQCERCESDRVADRSLTRHPEAPYRGGWGTRLASPAWAGV